MKVRMATYDGTLDPDPCLCRKAGDTGEDCPWKCPPYRPGAKAADMPEEHFPIVTRSGTEALGG